MAENLMDGLLSEMNRVRELISLYDEIPTGVFGATIMRQSIQKAERAISSGDVVEMLSSYEELKSHEG